MVLCGQRTRAGEARLDLATFSFRSITIPSCTVHTTGRGQFHIHIQDSFAKGNEYYTNLSDISTTDNAVT